ncbi:MAG: hypothetical protein IJX30_07800 [Clostridia bacterium]|nr:hypothetical protein [Clostridia bacterium]MBQ8429980.1 hypothetical protein [Clostridia bacterium]
MNALFFVVFTICTLSLLIFSPENFLPAMLDGASKSATLCVSLIATYAVWMGLMRLWEDSGVARGVSRLIKPALKRLLKTDDEQSLSAVSMNVSVNLLGISGAATPYGIKAAQLLDKTDNAEYSSAMFFVLNATSLQILPSSLVAVRVAMQSANPTDIILPTLIATVFSTTLGVLLTTFAYRKKSALKTKNIAPACVKTRGACTR